MKQSFYVYNNGDLKRKDNTLQFTNHDKAGQDLIKRRLNGFLIFM